MCVDTIHHVSCLQRPAVRAQDGRCNASMVYQLHHFTICFGGADPLFLLYAPAQLPHVCELHTAGIMSRLIFHDGRKRRAQYRSSYACGRKCRERGINAQRAHDCTASALRHAASSMTVQTPPGRANTVLESELWCFGN